MNVISINFTNENLEIIICNSLLEICEKKREKPALGKQLYVHQNIYQDKKWGYVNLFYYEFSVSLFPHFVQVKNTVCPSSADLNCNVA